MVLALGVAAFLVIRSPGSIVLDGPGVGAFTKPSDTSWGVDKTIVEIGEPWSAGSITLCKKSSGDHVVIRDVTPVSVRGQVRVDGIGVRTTRWGKPDGPSDPKRHLVGTMRGVPDGLQDPRGFTVTATCPDPDAPVAEIVVTLTKTGEQGGALDGLLVTYDLDAVRHQLTLDFHYGLCGTGDVAVPCHRGGE